MSVVFHCGFSSQALPSEDDQQAGHPSVTRPMQTSHQSQSECAFFSLLFFFFSEWPSDAEHQV